MGFCPWLNDRCCLSKEYSLQGRNEVMLDCFQLTECRCFLDILSKKEISLVKKEVMFKRMFSITK